MPPSPAISATQWRERAAALKPRSQVFIDGRFVSSANGATFDNINPATGRSLGMVSSGEQIDIERAVASARGAFRKGSWAHQPPRARKKVLLKLADLMMANREELALLETLDMGKPISDSLASISRPPRTAFAGMPKPSTRSTTKVAPTGHNSLATITREAMGVVGAIVPWNFPLLMASWKIGPVLASGNSLVLKASEKSPLTALRIAELAGRGGSAGRRVQCRARVSVTPRARRSRCPMGRRLHRIHRLDGDRQDGDAIRRAVDLKKVGARVRRQVAEHRARRLPRISTRPRPLRPTPSSSTRARCVRPARGLLVEASIKDAMLEKIAAWAVRCCRAIRSIPRRSSARSSTKRR
jgi:hypothetical protein